MLALPPPNCDEDKVLLVACGFCPRRRQLEPAGRAFHAAHEKPALEAKQRGRKKPEAADRGEGSGDEAPADASWKKKRKQGNEKRGALKLSPHLAGVDLYALLEVPESASAEQIKKQYRKLVLQHHPDKHGGGDAGEAAKAPTEKGGLSEKDMLFVKIQEAYEILADEARRRQYDSTLDVDDSIPDEAEVTAESFYATFAAAFRRNARWSTRQPVPDIGDEKTDMNRVRKFYDFWFSFDSWRDFSVHDEYNLDEAEFREERRWMDRQNQKIRKKYQDAERKRIMRLTELAERFDPRIRAEREEKEAKKREEKERRAKAKQDEEEAKRLEAEEKRRQEEQEQAEREEKARVEKEKSKQLKQAVKTLRQRVKKCVQSSGRFSATEAESVQEMCLSMEAEALEALCGRVEAAVDGSKVESIVRAELEECNKRKALELEELERRRQEARRREEQKASEAKGSAGAAAAGAAWSVEEMGLLAKALQKFPGGMGGRWALIAQHLCCNGFQRTEKEVIAKTKEVSEGQSLRAMGSCVSAEGSVFQTAKAKAAPAAAKAAAAATAVSEKPAEGSASAASEWTAEQQKALEAALQKYPASLDKNERWRLIAEEVPDKTKGQCVERFKFLREQVLKQKKG